MGDGWQPILTEDMSAITAAWTRHHQPWPELAAEFAGKLLSALRHCARPGERLWVIEWQHTWYYLDPSAAAGGWPYPPLPDGDACNVVAPDFRFGVISGWRATGPVTLFGAELLAALAADPPVQFLRVCGPGVLRPAKLELSPDPQRPSDLSV
jgi:hypothetical protein